MWSAEDKAIVAGYRFIDGKDIIRKPDGSLLSATAELFQFSDEFMDKYLSNTVELGRSFVQPDFEFRDNIYLASLYQ